ncbi:YiaA/YiaB family inner membrane protein [Streptococcus respiraculi]|uniref:YiaA/YiaB family inner membrane protein n=1 Tax=Streptococcus respiraculi TaxID=2021971 RepID=UPI000E71C220|nr:YiaA/YiaB family inner membrane protein [Streptococcus respiraculi]
MNKVKKKIYRNTPAFTLMAQASFAFFATLILIGLYTLKEPLMVKGYYLMGFVGLISSSFTISKVVRDNQEDEDNYNLLLQKATIDEDTDK